MRTCEIRYRKGEKCKAKRKNVGGEGRGMGEMVSIQVGHMEETGPYANWSKSTSYSP